ncbi:tRNA (adenosine(37)-N6)-threonylcarbamoyltransferase complex ATPase subunit type 1 TsaE [Maricaulis sp.]|uniref:tRNA (adenosine(37)-N6)-threonylcarbamoyltransferase complex ATPase subunit type 1 TsaE n=1 Tax=Maricaulis sp. TaxID=1486257 RepID=UPI00260DCFA8|nr:tRNA (adenosine(37)-N6)-threonylcarbamoyltransferase complex ATPase subunit type 1 TsaE [Maricaulis sp.]
MGTTRTARLDDLDATRRFGARLAQTLDARDVILLSGDLGMGKTTLARAIIAKLCGVEDAPSPTYTLIQTYDCLAGGELWHADLYRIEEPSELDELGLDEAFDTAICLIEWPDRLGSNLPPDRIEIELAAASGGLESGREARITGYGRWEDKVEQI